MALTQRETALLKELKSQEELCVEKYTRYAESSYDPQLKNLFNDMRNTEQQHLSKLNGIEGQPASSSASTTPISAKKPCAMADVPDSKQDKYLCSDALAGEKHVSQLYDTCIFEFKDTALRDTLNQIQKEEQGHGEKIYNYMAQNNMYQ